MLDTPTPLVPPNWPTGVPARFPGSARFKRVSHPLTDPTPQLTRRAPKSPDRGLTRGAGRCYWIIATWSAYILKWLGPAICPFQKIKYPHKYLSLQPQGVLFIPHNKVSTPFKVGINGVIIGIKNLSNKGWSIFERNNVLGDDLFLSFGEGKNVHLISRPCFIRFHWCFFLFE